MNQSSASDGALRRSLGSLWARFPVLAVLIVIIAAWEAAVDIGHVPSYLLPPPSSIWVSLIEHRANLLTHTWVTLLETLAGFGLSIAIGVPLAALIVYSRVFDRIVYPILIASQSVPKVALAPILLVALGYGILPKIIVAFLIAFFPVVVNTVSGLASVDRDTLKLMRSMGATKLTVFSKVRFPHAVPSMIAGFKVAIALAVVGAVVGEFVGGRSGLGYYMMLATGNFDAPLVFACVVVLTVMGIVLFYAVGLLELLMARWNRSARIARAAELGGAFGM
ncbi:ABC transporter permease [Paraburkholderia sp. Ac-20342]|uniref:ABC transporter permease n=1 Tax=Paraburkholderia sp. Ac-20342 TaxID=2703889 RepID=UPI001981E039|nr:ABC transporter permease [Paraburkholderia sp. Ac-20342]MBN3849309.1 ABC transporter permease [Paraburkholderia sp. Ac-20342]